MQLATQPFSLESRPIPFLPAHTLKQLSVIFDIRSCIIWASASCFILFRYCCWSAMITKGTNFSFYRKPASTFVISPEDYLLTLCHEQFFRHRFNAQNHKTVTHSCNTKKQKCSLRLWLSSHSCFLWHLQRWKLEQIIPRFLLSGLRPLSILLWDKESNLTSSWISSHLSFVHMIIY